MKYLDKLTDLTVVSIKECQWYRQKTAKNAKNRDLSKRAFSRSQREKTDANSALASREKSSVTLDKGFG